LPFPLFENDHFHFPARKKERQEKKKSFLSSSNKRKFIVRNELKSALEISIPKLFRLFAYLAMKKYLMFHFLHLFFFFSLLFCFPSRLLIQVAPFSNINSVSTPIMHTPVWDRRKLKKE
jgi:hypothetical protein